MMRLFVQPLHKHTHNKQLKINTKYTIHTHVQLKLKTITSIQQQKHTRIHLNAFVTRYCEGMHLYSTLYKYTILSIMCNMPELPCCVIISFGAMCLLFRSSVFIAQVVCSLSLSIPRHVLFMFSFVFIGWKCYENCVSINRAIPLRQFRFGVVFGVFE